MNEIADNFRNCFAAELRAHQRSEPVLSRFIEELEAIDCSAYRIVSAKVSPPTVTNHLETALDRTGCAQLTADAVRQLARLVEWYEIFQGEGIDRDLARGLVAGQVAGPVGIVASSSIRAGLFLLAPDIHYPLHQHAALEIYFVVSGMLILQHGRSGTAFHLRPGQWSVTPCHRVHSLTTHGDPCLVIYAWIGEFDAPNWWWEQVHGGTWRRVRWERQPDARWLRTAHEPVTEEVLKEAGEEPAEA